MTNRSLLGLLATASLLFAACSDPESDPAPGPSDSGSDALSDTSSLDAGADTQSPLNVASIQPASGPSAGGTAVIISGTGFSDVQRVLFGATDATDVSRISDFQIEATTPAADTLGSVDVTVELTSGGSATLTSGFEYTATPPPQLRVGYCVLQSPDTTTSAPGEASEPIYGRVYVEGCSEADAQCDRVSAQLGWGTPQADPSTDPDAFDWTDASYNPGHASDDNDEFQAAITSDDPGEYAYAFRFRVDEDWVYCDLDGSENGFSADQMGLLSVEEAPPTPLSFCIIQAPSATFTAPGAATEPIYGRAYVAGCTDSDARCADLEAELGFGDPAVDPSASPADYAWSAATYNPGHTADDNDEFQATLSPGLEGDFAYAYRFRRADASDWLYCDTDGTENGFSTDKMGTLTVDTATIGWCNLQFPETFDALVGEQTDVFGQVYVAGCTDAGQDCQPLLAQLGVGPADADASADPASYTWSDATRNAGFAGDANDEFVATLTASQAGSFAYAYRMSGDAGQTWVYCDTDGLDNGFSADKQGTMSVATP